MLHRFPKFEFSPPSNVSFHPNKQITDDNVYMAIPKGKKYYAWFTFYKKFNICLFIDATTQYTYYEKVPYSSLSLGTVLYGTMVEYKTHKEKHGAAGSPRHREFVAENIFYYEGQNLEKTMVEKLELFAKIFENRQIIPVETKILLAPMWRGKFPDDQINKNKIYQVYNLTNHSAGAATAPAPAASAVVAPPAPAPPQSKPASAAPTAQPQSKPASAAPTAPHAVKKNTNTRKLNTFTPQVFWVKADIINDIYHLFTSQSSNVNLDTKLKYHSIAFIPNYKTSVFMNSIFRKIKENTNLDLLEESDDEEEFQDISYNKYVNLDKIVKMQCIFHNKFKKWIPVKIVE